MGWLLDLLFEGLREMCSQFIVDLMDVASGMFTEILSCDLNLFEELFGVAGDLYQNAIMPIAIMLLLMIVVWQLFKSMFGKAGVASEDPIELILRTCFCLFMIAFAKDIVNYILDLAGTPFEWVVGTGLTIESFSGYVSAAEAVISVLGVDMLTIQLIMLIMQFVVAWNYFKMLFLLAERYVLLGVFSYTAPLAFATGGAKATNNILASWTKMFGGQVLIVILDAWCLKMFLAAYGNMMASGYGFTKFFAATMCMVGFCKITVKLDSYMASLGVNLGRSGGGLSGLAALMFAGRMFHTGGSSRSSSSGKTGSGTGGAGMSFGSRPIPMGGPDSGGGGMSGAGNGAVPGFGTGMVNSQSQAVGAEAASMSGYSGMEGGAGTPEADRERGAGNLEEQEMSGQNLPFGTPQDEAAQAEIPEGLESMEDAADGTSPEGIGSYQEEDAGMLSDTGEIPDGEESMLNGPFGQAFEEAGEIPEDTGMEGGGIQEDTDAGGLSGEGIPSYGEQGGLSGAYAGIQTDGGSVEGTGTEGGITPMSETGPVSGQEGTAGASEGQTVSTGIQEMESGQEAGYAEHIAAGTEAGAYKGQEARGESSSAYSEGNAMPAGSMAGALREISGQGTISREAGAYPMERDGQHYMRYDAGQYEKPQGAYQTVHENGKTFYELPEQQTAPALRPETKAVLEKDGSLRLEKVYRERIPEKKAEQKANPERRQKKKPGQQPAGKHTSFPRKPKR